MRYVPQSFLPCAAADKKYDLKDILECADSVIKKYRRPDQFPFDEITPKAVRLARKIIRPIVLKYHERSENDRSADDAFFEPTEGFARLQRVLDTADQLVRVMAPAFGLSKDQRAVMNAFFATALPVIVDKDWLDPVLQKKYLARFGFKEYKKYLFAGMQRQEGKSFVMGICIAALMVSFPITGCGYAVKLEQARIIQSYAYRALESAGYQINSNRSEDTISVSFGDGTVSVYRVFSMNADAARGYSGQFAIIDEWGFVNDDTIYINAMPPLANDFRFLVATSSPTSPDSPRMKILHVKMQTATRNTCLWRVYMFQRVCQKCMAVYDYECIHALGSFPPWKSFKADNELKVLLPLHIYLQEVAGAQMSMEEQIFSDEFRNKMFRLVINTLHYIDHTSMLIFAFDPCHSLPRSYTGFTCLHIDETRQYVTASHSV